MTRLRDRVREYLALRRALGYRLEREGVLLPQFADFVEAQQSPYITTALALTWATQPVNASAYWSARRLGLVRTLAVYVSALDPRTEIPPADLLPYRRQRTSPYLYSEADVTALLQACTRLRDPLIRATYTTLLALLAVTGLRVGEAIGLDRPDVDTREPRLIIRHAKFNKSREVPLHATTVAALQAYARTRDRLLRRPHSPSFFLSRPGRRLLVQNVWQTFARLRRVAGLPSHPRAPRLHDLRHSFAVNTLLGWYREGVDVPSRLPLLSTYLGHVRPSMTYWYLTATPELLELAAHRAARQRGGTP
jgi:integrase